jgi:Do/DeqQ family serine protease
MPGKSVLIVLLPIALLLGIAQHLVPEANTALPATAIDRPVSLPTLAPLLAATSPAVANISVQGTVEVQENPLLQDPLFRRFFGLPDRQAPSTQRFRAVGSAVIIDEGRGYLLTNNHVIDHADKIQVTLKDRRRLNAKIVGADPQTDVAVLQIESDHLTAIPIGDARSLKEGDYVLAIGNPFGIGQTATFGIISALGRTGLGIDSYEDFIQTDASINPGNSGGALVDMNGRLIGINAAILSNGGGNVGVGFAIPIDMAMGVAKQLIASGKVSRGALGLTAQDLTPDLAQAMNADLRQGAVVAEVQPNSAASKAGIHEGDIVTSVDGTLISSSSHLRNLIGQKSPGTAVRVNLLRDGKAWTTSVRLDPAASRQNEQKVPGN